MDITRKEAIGWIAALTVAGVSVLHDARAQPARRAIDYPDGRGGAAVVTVVGEVVAVDLPNRVVSLRGPEGHVAVVAVDPVVRNLEQVRVGDRVQLRYRVGVALALKKGGDGIREKVETEAAGVAARGQRPGGTLATRTTLVANVDGVDRAHRIVTLKDVKGRLVDVRVRDAAVLHDVQVGDQVVASITESVALRVRPAP